MSDKVRVLLASKGADDIVYALSRPEYFGLTTKERNEVSAFVFAAINVATLDAFEGTDVQNGAAVIRYMEMRKENLV